MLRKYLAALLCAIIPCVSGAAEPTASPETLFIRDTLLQKGLALGLDKSPELEKQVAAFREEQIARLALNAALEEGMPDFTARAEELYQVRKEKQYQLPLRLRVRVLESSFTSGTEATARSQLENLRSQILAGKLDFKAAVLAHSSDPERKFTEGDSQWFSAGQKPDVLYAAAEQLTPEKPFSDIVMDENRAYLLHYLDRKAPEVRSFDEVKAEIISELQQAYRDTQRKVVMEKFRTQFQQQLDKAAPPPQAAAM